MSVQTVCDWCQNKMGLEAIYVGSINQGNLDNDNQAVIDPSVPTLTRHFHPYCWELFYAAATGASPAPGGPVPAPNAPVISSLNPASGPQAGGTSVLITGTNLSLTTSVKFGNAWASFSISSDTAVTATVPPGTGTVDVVVQNIGGTSSTSASTKFTYNAPLPTISSISPGAGSPAGGPLISISGSGFNNASSVKFGSTSATFIVNSDSSITATLPAGTANATVDVAIITPVGTSPTGQGSKFNYTAALKESESKSSRSNK